MHQCVATLHLDDYLKIMALLGASIAFGVGLFQYRRAQRWKRAEFLANEMKEFFATPRVQKALLLIDWGRRRVQLLEDRTGDESCRHPPDADYGTETAYAPGSHRFRL
jgi:hypothetical protein